MNIIKPAKVKNSTKRNTTIKEAEPRKSKKKLRRRMKFKKDDEEDEVERTELDDLSQSRVATHKNLQHIDEVCENIRSSAGLSSFQFIKYDKLSKENNNKVEE